MLLPKKIIIMKIVKVITNRLLFANNVMMDIIFKMVIVVLITNFILTVYVLIKVLLCIIVCNTIRLILNVSYVILDTI